jgi:hypothetical protein
MLTGPGLVACSLARIARHVTGIGVNRLGVGAHRKDGAIHFAFPLVILVGKV